MAAPKNNVFIINEKGAGWLFEPKPKPEPEQRRMSKEEEEFSKLLNYLMHIGNIFKPHGLSIDDFDLDSPKMQEILSKSPSDERETYNEIITKIKDTFAKIEALLKSSAEIDINHHDPYYKVTYLHMAAGSRTLKLVQLLLLRNPDPTIQNCLEQTPAQRARFFALSPEIADILEQYQLEYDKKQNEKGKDAVSKPDSTSAASAAGDATAAVINLTSASSAASALMAGILVNLASASSAASSGSDRGDTKQVAEARSSLPAFGTHVGQAPTLSEAAGLAPSSAAAADVASIASAASVTAVPDVPAKKPVPGGSTATR